MSQLKPARIEYRGPEGFTVITNEDGVHLGREGRVVLESVDLTKLLELIAAARAQFEGGYVPAPAPPTREEMREASYDDRNRYAARRAIRAIEGEFKGELTGVAF